MIKIIGKLSVVSFVVYCGVTLAWFNVILLFSISVLYLFFVRYLNAELCKIIILRLIKIFSIDEN